MLHGARWLLNKDIVRGANSYPLKGAVGENRTRAPSPSYLPETRGMDEQGPRIRRRQEEERDRRLSAPGITTGFEANDFPRARAGGGVLQGRDKGGVVKRTEEQSGRWLKATEKEEWLLLALRRILIELLAAFLSLLSHARAALSVFGFV